MHKIIDKFKKLGFKEMKVIEKITFSFFSLFFAYWILASNPFQETLIFREWSIIVNLLLFAILFFCVFILLLIIKKVSLKGKDNNPRKIEAVFFFLITILVLLLYLGTYFPGFASYDSFVQWSQVQSGNYNDWHPILHTLLFFKFPTLIWNNPASCVIFQMFFISSIITYTCFSLRKFGVSKLLVWLLLTIYLLQPSTGSMAMTLWKDVPFSYSLLLLTVLCMWIYHTKGEWIKSLKNMILLGFVLLLVLFLRHNGIIAVFPSLVLIMFFYRKYFKQIVFVSAITLSTYFLITGPVYDKFDITGHSAPFSEMMGVPSNQMLYIFVHNGNITDEQLGIMNNIASIDAWRRNYSVDSFNNVKSSGYYNRTYIEDNKDLFLSTWLDMVINNKKMAVTSYYNVSKPVWGIFGYNSFSNYSYTLLMPEYETNPIFNEIGKPIKWYNSLRGSILFKLIFLGSGMSLFLMSLVMVAKGSKDLKKLIVIAPTLLNSLGIMLLITGREIRFVYANVLIVLPLLCFMFIERNNYDKKISK